MHGFCFSIVVDNMLFDNMQNMLFGGRYQECINAARHISAHEILIKCFPLQVVDLRVD